MEHLFHPWHWVPVLMALPFVGTMISVAKLKVARRLTHVEEHDHNPEG